MPRRLTILSFLLICFTASYAQIPGKKIDGPVTIAGVSFKEGDVLNLGAGTSNMGNFRYIYMPSNAFVSGDPNPLPKNWTGKSLPIKFFKLESSKKYGEKIWVVVNPAVYNYAVELEAAINAGEVTGVNGTPLTKNTGSSTVSVADELLKLKQLLDAGAITQGEFDQQKKKLLSQ